VNRRETGAQGEQIAVNYLKRKGYRIRERNFRCREGEIDIVAEKGSFLVFVEVRTKKDTSFGTPEESITASKKDKLIALAQTYVETHSSLPASWRIDVVAIELDKRGKISRLRLIKNAIS
jgi:putative endonuclease